MRPCPGRCRRLVQSGFCTFCVAKGKGVTARKSSVQRGYGEPWRKYRLGYLISHPFCVDPANRHSGVTVIATNVDHIRPHRGSQVLFWDRTNHQPLCGSCHSYKTATEDGGFGH